MNVFGYTRVSSKGQVEGDGPERQAAAIAKFCQAHKLQLGQISNEVITGTSEGLDRPVFSAILEQAPCILVVEKMDRLARDLMVSELLLRECRNRKVTVYAADQGALIDMASDTLADPTRTLIRQVLGAVAQFEKSALVLKLKQARDRIIAKEGKCGGALRYGQYPNEAQRLRIMRDFLEANHSLTKVAELMNQAGFKTRFGKAWNKTSVWAVTKKDKKCVELI